MKNTGPVYGSKYYSHLYLKITFLLHFISYLRLGNVCNDKRYMPIY